MKVVKFGAFPKTEGVDTKANQQDFQSTFLKLLPMLFNKNQPPSPKKEENIANLSTRVSADAMAYREYLARHDAFVKLSKENKKTP